MRPFKLSLFALAALPAVGAAQGTDAKAIYLKSCKECHGVLGRPTKAALRKYDSLPDFALAAFFARKDEKDLIKAVRDGKGRDMKGFKDKLSPEEIEAVVKYIYTLVKDKEK